MSTPDAVVPMMSNTPMRASRLAAATGATPWSWAAGRKCVPMSPLVLAPQTKKLPASSQKVPLCADSRSPAKATATGLPVAASDGGSSVAP